MRITQNFSIESLLRQINLNRERISTLQRNLSTGKRINQISDDPEKIETALRYRNLLKYNSRFEENINNAAEFLTFTSNALDDSAEIVARIKELAIQGIDSTSSDEFNAIAEQVDELIQQLVNIGNTRFKDRYIFGGNNVNSPPFTMAPDLSAVNVNPDGIDGKLKVELGQGKIDQYNITGQEAYLSQVDIFQTMIDLRDAFSNQDSAALTNLIPQVDASLDQLLQTNTKVGAKINRYNLLLEQYQNEDIRLQKFLSAVEDTDVPKTIVELQSEQMALEAALKTLSQTVKISLVDFI